MARYSKVLRSMWGDAKFRRLSAPKANAQTLWFRLLTGPELGPIPGLFDATPGGLADALGWSREAFLKAFGEAIREGMADADWEVGLVFLPNAIRHNEPNSINVVKSWSNEWIELPECGLKNDAHQHLKAWAKAKGKAWLMAFDTACRKPCAMQEQEQESEQKDPPHGPPQGEPRARGTKNRLVPMPSDWAPNDTAKKRARELSLGLHDEVENFKLWTTAKNTKYARDRGWDAGFLNHLKSQATRRDERNPQQTTMPHPNQDDPPPKPPTPEDIEASKAGAREVVAAVLAAEVRR